MNTLLVIVDSPGPQLARVTLNRPDRRNALTIQLMADLTAAIETAASDSTKRVLILRGAGPAFCAGLDLQETADKTKAHASAEMVAKMLLAVSETRLVTIATVHGAAVAGGAGLMSACDFVIAARGTKIGYPEVRRGLVAGLVMTFLRRQLRERDIRELLLEAELIDAERARQIGLVNRVVEEDRLESEAQEIAIRVVFGAPNALTNSKKLLDALWSTSVREDIETALKHHLVARESDEAVEGIAAFLEKRAPRWSKP